MAKMFYTLEETAELLGKSTTEVKGMVTSGKLKEFRDKDSLIFKKEQVDLLAHNEDDDTIPLADSRGGSGMTLSLEDSGGGSGGIQIDESPKEKSGISIFDTEDLDTADPSALTQVSNTGAQELTMESVGSGSGLLDLTREGDDTSLGADLLEDVYQGDDSGGNQGDTQAASGLFESTSAPSDVSSSSAMAGMGSMALIAAEPYDGAGSGMVGGAALGAIAVLAVATTAMLLALVGAGENPVVNMVAGNGVMWLGIGAAVIVVFTVVGWLLGKKSG
ncbi:MAG: helix-turn-helix domain-containing protein [Pyrinomonadaceae bacterium]|nr:helix-turn-helix domain-containing protein [Phycisphaerales bacterium]